MAKYIDVDKALKQIKELQETDPATVEKKQFAEGFFCGLDEAEVILMRTSTADVAEVKHGHFIAIKAERETHGTLGCSCCKYIYKRLYPRNYRPYCGAKMDGKPPRVNDGSERKE